MPRSHTVAQALLCGDAEVSARCVELLSALCDVQVLLPPPLLTLSLAA